MNMDLSLMVGDEYKLNIRAAGMIIHNNKILLHRNKQEEHYCIIGGRIEIGEDSKTTVKREMEEEIGKKVEVKNFLATIENFFTDLEGVKFHEFMFIYEAEFVDDDKKIEYTLKNLEGKDYLQYEWINIDKIDEINLQPKILKEMIKDKKYPTHKIYIDN